MPLGPRTQAGAWRSLLTGNFDADTYEAKLAAARGAANGEAALAVGVGLPEAVLDYIAGAIEFRAFNDEDALRYFKAINRLPPEQRLLALAQLAQRWEWLAWCTPPIQSQSQGRY